MYYYERYEPQGESPSLQLYTAIKRSRAGNGIGNDDNRGGDGVAASNNNNGNGNSDECYVCGGGGDGIGYDGRDDDGCCDACADVDGREGDNCGGFGGDVCGGYGCSGDDISQFSSSSTKKWNVICKSRIT